MATKNIDIVYNQKNAGSGASDTVNALKRVEQAAEQTKAKMEKLAQVGMKLTMLGGAIVAPFALAMKKYVDTAKETEPVSKRIVALSKKWEDSQVRLGRVTATIVLPYLEKGAAILEKVISFAEKNPEVVRGALTIGASLIVLGGIVTTVAQIVSTLATITSLGASLGQALGAGGAAAAGGGAAAGAGGGGIAAAIVGAAPAIGAALATAFAVWAGGNLGILITNALTGQNYTMTDLGNVARMILAVDAAALDRLIGWFGGHSDFFGAVSTALGISTDQQGAIMRAITGEQTNALRASADGNAKYVGGGLERGLAYIGDAIKNFFSGSRASGGYVGAGLYRMHPHEFVMNRSTTENAERAIGGRLTQEKAMAYVTNNLNIGQGMTIGQTKRMVQRNERNIYGTIEGAFG